ncbi:hypothetical protein [Poriferisphaera corsica]|nr:hypothetical protein [Poriferisphaera corsica]
MITGLIGDIDLNAQDTEAAINTGRLHVMAGANTVSAYHLRGLIFEDDGVILQPWAVASFNVYQGSEGDRVKGVNINLMGWGSIHEKRTTAKNSPEKFYENDYFAGVQFVLDGGWMLEGGVHTICWPSGTRDAATELYGKFNYDDSGLWEAWGVEIEGFNGLQPWGMLSIEVDNTFMGIPGKRKSGFVDLGITPGFTLSDSKSMPMRLNLPVTIGFGLRDYYGTNDSSFGFAKLGVSTDMPLTMLPKSYGNWQVNAGVDFVLIGDSPRSYNDGHDSFKPIGVIGFAMSY